MAPLCKHMPENGRTKVNLFLDIPFSLEHRLSKKNLRLKDVKIEGAGWDSATIYCDKCGKFTHLGHPMAALKVALTNVMLLAEKESGKTITPETAKLLKRFCQEANIETGVLRTLPDEEGEK